ncbi:MAG TPA: twin-arginine translocation signal domain-containing protein, partial [Bacteroidetes bacterium]|nr:twin-arginine translocation signal domain-containing protein [Bacteroidota bacterium]
MPKFLTRRDFLRAAGTGVAAVGLFGLQGCASPSGNRFAASGRERPNFLFLFTDDQAFRTVH